MVLAIPILQKKILPVNPVAIKNDQSGYALLEIMLAFAVSVIIITGMISLGVSSVRALTFSRAYSEAGKIAQREVDRLKLLRDTSVDWSSFVNSVGSCTTTTKCSINVTNTPITVNYASSSVGGGSGEIQYYFTVSIPPTGEINYTVVTTWKVGDRVRTYKIEGVFTNWKEM